MKPNQKFISTKDAHLVEVKSIVPEKQQVSYIKISNPDCVITSSLKSFIEEYTACEGTV